MKKRLACLVSALAMTGAPVTDANRDGHQSMQHGWTGTFDQFAGYLAMP